MQKCNQVVRDFLVATDVERFLPKRAAVECRGGFG
jgi:hypothetical protein